MSHLGLEDCQEEEHPPFPTSLSGPPPHWATIVSPQHHLFIMLTIDTPSTQTDPLQPQLDS